MNVEVLEKVGLRRGVYSFSGDLRSEPTLLISVSEGTRVDEPTVVIDFFEPTLLFSSSGSLEVDATASFDFLTGPTLLLSISSEPWDEDAVVLRDLFSEPKSLLLISSDTSLDGTMADLGISRKAER